MDKKLMCLWIMLIGTVTFAVTSRQLYKIIYYTTGDKNQWVYVDRISLGTSTDTAKLYTEFWSTGTAKIGGLYISTCATGWWFSTDNINGIDLSDLANSSATFKVIFDSFTTVENWFKVVYDSFTNVENQFKVVDDSLTVVENRFKVVMDSLALVTPYQVFYDSMTKAENISKTKFDINTVIYTTVPVSMVFISTDITAGTVIYQATFTWKCPTSIIVKKSWIGTGGITGSFAVGVSTGDNDAGTFVTVSTGAALCNAKEYNSGCEEWKSTKVFPAGCVFRFWVSETPVTLQQATYGMTYCKPLW